MKVKCILVDDEPIARDIIEQYIQDMPQLELVAKCSNAFEAMSVLQNEDISLVFLDINMPRLSGLNLVRSLSHPPLIIFITAYPEFAVEGFEVEATDYILKPFSFERFIKAVNKAFKKMASPSSPLSDPGDNTYLVVKADKRLHKINYQDILYFSAIGDYMKVHTPQKVLITKETLKNIETHLPPHQFIRVHKSYIISVDAIQYIEGNQVKVNQELLPIGLTYKDKLLERLNQKD